MLRRDELRWLPWAPLLLAEGLYARLATTRLPPAAEVEGRAGVGRAVRLVGLGDSIIAGIGVPRHSVGLLGQVSRRIASRAGVAVEWSAVGQSGSTSALVIERLLPRAIALEPRLVVLSVGVNDAVAGVQPSQFKERLTTIVDALAGSARRPAVVFGGIPPLASFPALPWPLSRLLDDRARGLQRAAVDLVGYRGLRVVNFPPRIDARVFAPDGFHPGEAGCAAWADWVADAFALSFESLAASGR
jgi:lysophospholipase L1-like esterase